MKKLLKKLTPQSRKLAVMIVGVVLYIANDLAGGIVSQQAMQGILGLVIAWLVGQSIADNGAQGKAKAVQQAMDDTQEYRDLLVQVLGQGTPIADKLDRTKKAEAPVVLNEGESK